MLLAKRLPDVEILTAGGPGVPALAACYARSRGLSLVAIPIEHIQHHGNTIEQRDARLIELADAAVLVGDASEVRELLARVAAKGLRMVAVGVGARGEPRNQVYDANGLADELTGKKK
ncbi:MAG: hypothetical protein K8U57_15995 [Planctomycetes bacterium]|nr:hypothetical protein [Planctomycetota bacterium]